MFEDRNYKRTFYSAPQSVQSFIAAFLEPSLIVLVYLAVLAWFGEPVMRSTYTLCMLVFALTFPGRNHFGEHPASAVTDIIGSWLMLLLILGMFAYATSSLHYFERDVLMWWAILTPLSQIVAVEIGRQVLRWRSRQPWIRRSAIIVGAGPLGAKVARALEAGPMKGVELLGFFDDRQDDRLHGDTSGRILGTLPELSDFVRAHGVREVYITLPLGSQPRIVQLLEQVQGTTASIFFVPDVFGISIIQGRLQDMNGVPVVGILETPFTGVNEVVKRISDIILASLILLLISPILVALAIGVKLSSPGPIIFKQRRNGLDGDEIIVYKFRSMRSMDNGAVVKQATKGDPRITPFGAFIRRTSLDELPQFINVLQGRMSIVGPRPHAVAHNEEYRQIIKAYMVRHKVKPGITGWAQVNGLRGETDTIDKMKARVEYDLEYLRNWSLGLDLQIIVRTVRLMVFDRHAY
ncbi:undecaprenyl-phosphate glucose phosphotransferase [Roseateles depolymerans]|uniref:Polysaccharide biosynthesis protein, putative n=1 Tax=Roseateles depolymerans TaxID=76731 RepID=A0A0U2U8M0_9BURK|nr:undecaprenyl-phosphate glucose phosphotransferase [Roseateles depolymerans]ALV08305.1 Polysaccharide biosynthesis protein, putative [Roseateles depolymerans]REG21471.1 putative colanic acid biosynthesis UDP-glucose lipid carrier transferase [Roseateles depolymerans]